MQAAPAAGLNRITEALGLPTRSEPFRPVMKRLGSKFKTSIASRPATPKEMEKADRDFMVSELDLELENALGYSYQ